MARSPRVLCAGLEGLVEGARLELAGEASHHVARVLRAAVGDAVTVFDGQGREARAHVARLGAHVVVALEEGPRAGVGRDRSGAVWLQGVPKGDKLESVVQKATELGVAALWPVYTERSVPRPARDAAAKTARLREVAASASAQSGRADVPDVREPAALDDALRALGDEVALRIVPWEQGGEPIASLLARTPRGDGEGGCAVLVGPEGGLSEREVERARAAGFVPVSLGPRIWRTETVAPALLAVLSYARGDLGLK